MTHLLINLVLLPGPSDIQKNQKLALPYKETVIMAHKRVRLKIYHLKLKKILENKEQLRTTVHYQCSNCIFCSTEA